MKELKILNLALCGLILFLSSCEEEQDPYLDLNSKCNDLFGDTAAWDAYLEECGGCDLFLREYNSMCFRRHTSGIYSLEWPEGCSKGSEVLMVVQGENNGLDVGFYYANPPKREFINNNSSAWVSDDVYQILPFELSEEEASLVDTCITDQMLFGVIEFDKVAFDLSRFHDEMPGELIWLTAENEEFKSTPLVFQRLEIPPYRERWDE